MEMINDPIHTETLTKRVTNVEGRLVHVEAKVDQNLELLRQRGRSPVRLIQSGRAPSPPAVVGTAVAATEIRGGRVS